MPKTIYSDWMKAVESFPLEFFFSTQISFQFISDWMESG